MSISSTIANILKLLSLQNADAHFKQLLGIETSETFADEDSNFDVTLFLLPADSATKRLLSRLGFQPVLEASRLLYRTVNDSQLNDCFSQIAATLSEASQDATRFAIARSPVNSPELLAEFIASEPLSNVTKKLKYNWFLQVLQNQSLFFKYQSIYNLQSGEVFGYECLARAFTERGECISGQQLIEAAIATNLTHEFDQAAREACIKFLGEIQSGQTFFINLLPNALVQHPQFLKRNIQQISQLGLHPEQIVFELTEVETLRKSPDLPKLIKQMQQWGFKIAIDDMGSTVAADHYFMELQPDYIKLDRQLIQGCSRHAIKQILIKSLLYSAHELGIIVIAEGLEDSEDIEFCLKLGVDLGQGFGLSTPQLLPEQLKLNLNQLISLKIS